MLIATQAKQAKKMKLTDLLKDSADKLTQCNPAQIAVLEASITLKTTDKVTTPFVICLVRGKPIKLTVEEAWLVCLRLPAICELIDLPTSASLYPAISEKDLLGLPIPNIPTTVQANIATPVQQSLTRNAQSERLLETAKRAVAIAIEQDEAAGMAYLAREGALA